MEIPKQYDPKQAEQNHYERWEKQGCFAPEINRDLNAPAFSIVIPPPNEKARSEEHTSELQSRGQLVCRLLLEKKKMLFSSSMGSCGATGRRDKAPQDLA